MHPAGSTCESFGKKPRFYLSHTYLVENAIERQRPRVGSSKPGLHKIVVRPKPQFLPTPRTNRR